MDPTKLSFGYGVRVCPGRIFAENALFTCIVQILSVFTIRKIDGDESSRTEVGYSPGAVSLLEPFQCRIEPRSAAHERLIRLAATT